MKRCLFLSCAALLLGCLSACSPGSSEDQQHLLSRIAYGPDPASLARIEDHSLLRYIKQQMAPSTLDDSLFESLAAAYPSRNMSYREMIENYDGESGRPGSRDALDEASRLKLLRSIYSERQLEAVLTDFWFNHFNFYANETTGRYAVTPYERDAIRANVFGRFEDMLLATARSPGMLEYLDNDTNRVGRINENYARELLELHTVGVDAGYTLDDIIDVARCFTGWEYVDSDDGEVIPDDGFRFDPDRHDTGAKTVMGLEIPAGGGMEDGLMVIQFLARHPKTAEHLSRKLIRRFVNENPSEEFVQLMTAIYLQRDGDLHRVMDVLLTYPEFWLEENRRGKVKRPLVMLASAARALRLPPEGLAEHLDDQLSVIGEGMFRARPPTGYPDVSGAWAGSGTLLDYVNAVYDLARDWQEFPPGSSHAEIADQLIAQLVPGGVGSSTRQQVIALGQTLESEASPERVVQEMAAALLASPEFMVH